MLLPSGRWNSHCRVVDVEWLMLLPLGRCYSPGSMILLQFKFWDVKQNLIPYMWQMVFANISIQGWIVDPDVKSLFYCPLEVLFLPSNNVEIFNTYAVTSGVKMVKYGGGAFWCSLNLSPEVLEDSLIYSSSHSTLITVDDPTFLHHRIYVPWGHQEVFNCCTSFKVDLYPIVTASLLYTFTQPLVIRYSYVWFRDVVLLSGTCLVYVFLVGWIVHLNFDSFKAHMG